MSIDTIRAMAFDVDGTIAGEDSQVSSRTLRALALLPRAGIVPVIVTGRLLPAALSILRDSHVDGYAVACNGAVCARSCDGRLLARTPMPSQMLNDLLDASDRFSLVPSVFSLEEIAVPDDQGPSPDFLALSNPGCPLAVRDLRTCEAFKVMFWGRPGRLDELSGPLRHRFPSLERSLPEFFETSAPGANKADTLLALLSRLGIPPEHCVGFGDGGNDVRWLRVIGHPIAMGNARPEVIAFAEEVVGDHRDDAVARWIEDRVEVGTERPATGPSPRNPGDPTGGS